jgi:ribonuclease G
VFDSQLKSQIAYFVSKAKDKRLTVAVHPYVAAYLKKGFPSLRLKWCFQYKCRIRIKANSSFSYLESKIYNESGEKLNE